MWTTWMFMLLVVFTSVSSRDLRIGAFNIQVFGRTKASKPDIMAILVKIIRRYDLLLIQEIRDSTNTSIHTLLHQVNEEQSKPFKIVLSDRLGRTSSKEQYAFLYRSGSGLTIKDQYVYDDGSEVLGVDTFEREPFIVSFSSDFTVMTNFGLAGIHVDPDDAVREINNLKGVFQDMKTRLSTNEVMVIGDLNADCRYVRHSKWSKIELKSDPAFYWWIGDDVDTTVKQTHCAYDRFISHGTGWRRGIVTGSARVYRFDEDPAVGAMDRTTAAAVSDHYSIEFVLQGKFHSISVRVYDVFIVLTHLRSGSLPVGSLYDLRVLDSNILVYKSGVLKGELRLKTQDEFILHEGLKSIQGSDVIVRVKPIKKRYRGKQRSVLYIEVPSTKSWIVSLWENVCVLFIDLHCKR